MTTTKKRPPITWQTIQIVRDRVKQGQTDAEIARALKLDYDRVNRLTVKLNMRPAPAIEIVRVAPPKPMPATLRYEDVKLKPCRQVIAWRPKSPMAVGLSSLLL